MTTGEATNKGLGWSAYCSMGCLSVSLLCRGSNPVELQNLHACIFQAKPLPSPTRTLCFTCAPAMVHLIRWRVLGEPASPYTLTRALQDATAFMHTHTLTVSHVHLQLSASIASNASGGVCWRSVGSPRSAWRAGSSPSQVCLRVLMKIEMLLKLHNVT
jgi:hypothetical protein